MNLLPNTYPKKEKEERERRLWRINRKEKNEKKKDRFNCKLNKLQQSSKQNNSMKSSSMGLIIQDLRFTKIKTGRRTGKNPGI